MIDGSDGKAEAARPTTDWQRYRKRQMQLERDHCLKNGTGNARANTQGAGSDPSNVRQRERIASEAAARAGTTASAAFRAAVRNRDVHTEKVKEADIAHESMMEENHVMIDCFSEMMNRKDIMTRFDAWSDRKNAECDTAQNKLDLEEIPRRDRAQQKFQQSKAQQSLRVDTLADDVLEPSSCRADYDEYLATVKRVEVARNDRNAKIDVCLRAGSSYFAVSADFKKAAAKHRRAKDIFKKAAEDHRRAHAAETTAAQEKAESMLEARKLRDWAKHLARDQLLRSQDR